MLWSDIARSTICGQIPGSVRRAKAPGYRVILVSDVLSSARQRVTARGPANEVIGQSPDSRPRREAR